MVKSVKIVNAGIAVSAGVIAYLILRWGAHLVKQTFVPPSQRPPWLESLLMGIAVIAIPQLVALLVYTFLCRNRINERKETVCRKCGYILRSLREPVCSECGEHI